MTTNMVTNLGSMPVSSAGHQTVSSGGNAFHGYLKNASAADRSSRPQQSTQSKDTAKAAKQDQKTDDTDAARTDQTDQMKSQQPDKATDSKADKTQATDQTAATEKNQAADETKTADETETATEADVAILAELQGTLQQAAAQLTQAVAQTLGISTEEVTDRMQQLNMPETAILQPQQLRNLMLSLTGNTEDSAILTDENLYTAMKDLNQLLQNLTDQLKTDTGLTANQLHTAEGIGDLTGLLQQIRQGTAQTTQAVQNVQTSQVSQQQTATLTTSENSTGNTAVLQTEGTKELQSLQPAQESDTPSQDGQGTAQQDSSFLQNLMQTLNRTAETQSTEAQPLQQTFSLQDTQDLLNQITDYMKVQAKPDETHLEMQLHPESLGTLNIHLTSKEGVMTAQFTTQNENVRAMIQSQILELRQNLENQGIRVDAVEVTVADYSQSNTPSDNRESSQQQSSEKKRSTRSIRLDALTSEEEIPLSGEDRLTAQIMRANGNSVDYTA